MNSFIELCKKIECRYIENAPISEYITFKVGGPCEVMCFPKTEVQIADILKYLISENKNYFVIGKGSNLIAYDEGYEGIIINTCDFDSIEFDDECTVSCTSGYSLTMLCRKALEHSLTGLEFAFGIPGSVGGAVYMNAGAYGGEIKDVIINCRYIDKDGIIKTYENADMNLSYRHSIFSDSEGLFILSATFKLAKGNPDEIKAKMDDLIGRRKSKQPLEYPSAGSTFKRPEGYFAGALIEECDLKGAVVGGAMVSEKHAGFVINKDGATAADIFNVIKLCQDKVYNEKGVKLETEVKVIK